MRLRACLAVLAWALAGEAAAQAGVTSYPAAYFAEAAPDTALDMVRRLPGFTFDEGDEDVRGYSGSGGNVLIDGQRPASKRDALDDLLERIPAAGVERIDLIRGGAPGIDMQGQSVLANVIRRTGGSSEGVVAVAVAVEAEVHKDRITPSLRLEGSRRWDDRSGELALLLEEELDDEGGEGYRRRFGPDGDLIRDALLTERGLVRTAELKGGYEQPLLAGALRLNGVARHEMTRSDQTDAQRFPDVELETVDEDEDLSEVELGLHFERPLGAVRQLELVAIQQLGWLSANERSREDDEEERFTEDTELGESIVRLAVHSEPSERLSHSVGAEAAFNLLESSAALSEDGVPQPLPGAEVRVEERRAEAFASGAWRAAETLTVEGELRAEFSRLTQSGDVTLERSFTYLKPRLALAWSPAEYDQWRLRLEREVGQLDFGDFVASASLDEGVVSAGAADLEPPKTWVAEVAWERRFWDEGALVVTIRREEIADVVDRVLFVSDGEFFDAPDNIGDGRRTSLEAALSLPLEKLLIPGGLLTATGAWRETEVTDPTTGETRRISGEEISVIELGFTQDRALWSWGLEATLAEREPEFRFDEVRLDGERTWVSAFVELRPARDWRLKIEAANLSGRDTWLDRSVFDGPRGAEPLDYRERRNLTFDPFLSVELRKTITSR